MAQAYLAAMSPAVLVVPPRPGLDGRPAAQAATRTAAQLKSEYCLSAAGGASVRGVGGTDAVLAARLAAGDDHALTEVFDALARSVYGSALRVLGDYGSAQDVVQDVFVELWAHPGRYDPAAGTLRTYLTVLARRRAVDVLRSELRRAARQERSYRLTPAPPALGAGDEMMATETASLIRAAVDELPPSQRQVIELAYFEGLTCREVAHAVGIPEGTAKSRLRLALAKLGQILDRELLESS
jgi:RNA polymerase sigma-70 factor, ECF subfamily